jgi:hypothetical protein
MEEKTRRWAENQGRWGEIMFMCCSHVVWDKSKGIGRRLEKEREAWGLLVLGESRVGSLIRFSVHGPT